MKNTKNYPLSISGLCLILLTVLFAFSQAHAQLPTAASNQPSVLRANFALSSVLSPNDSAVFNNRSSLISAFLDPVSGVIVNTLTDHDDGSCDAADCTLREAVKYAPAGATITFSVTGIIELINELSISIDKNLTINGPGAGILTVKGGFSYSNPIFDISGGIVGISGLKLTGGRGKSFNSGGSYGGAIYMTGGTVSIADSIFSGNFAINGGAIYCSCTLNVTRSSFTGNGNSGYGSGGAIYIGGGSMVMNSSSIYGNGTTPGNVAGLGGGIYSHYAAVTITNSTISGNTAKYYDPTIYGWGGGIFTIGGSMTVTNSTISGNSAWGSPQPNGGNSAGNTGGGGIWNDGTALTVANSTITGNSGYRGGGILILSSEPVNLSNSIVAGNGATHGADIYGYPYSGTYNIIGQDPKLGPLQNNGGSTQTHALLTGSPAIDAGDPNFDAGVTPYDQRGSGFPRVYNGRVDIGAYETVPFIVNTLSDHDDGQCGSTDCTLREAVKYAPAGATISFSVTGTITLGTQGEIIITKSLTITGPASAPGVTVSGNNASRIFYTNTAVSVAFSNLTLSGGNGAGTTATGIGGAIYINTDGIVTITNCTLSGNNATGNGGAIRNGGTLTVANSTITGNTATGNGGGIQNGRTLTVGNSTITSNAATGTGGGIQSGNNLTLMNSTITGNSASGANGGGGISFTVSLGSPQRSLFNSIVAGNSAPNGPDINGAVTGGSYNLVGKSDGSTGLTNNTNGNQTGTINAPLDPKLDTLKNNGGPTQTHALLVGSPALNAGDPNFDTTNTPYDQRGSGYARKSGSAVDIGAFEVQDSTPTSTAINTQPENQTVCESAPANFSVGASGESLHYQWRKDAVNLTDDSTIFGATSANLMISSAATSNAGSYDVVVSGSNGTATSNAATLTVNSAPAITAQPVDLSVNSGANATFTATADRAESIQWQVSTDGGTSFSDIGGATTATLTLPTVTAAQTGSKYRAVFSGPCGTPAISNAATLTVGKIAQNITFDAIEDRTYGDAPFTLAASASSNLPVGFTVVSGAATVSGNTLTINGAGAVTVSAAQTGNDQYNAAPSVERSFNVGKAQATITFSNLSQTYDGTAKAATATTNPSGLSIFLTYDGSSTAPTNSGSYAVAATINDANYQGTANGTLTIAKATPVITWSNPADIAYGTKLGAAQLNATASVAGSFAYNPLTNTLLNAGANQSLSATFTPDDANNYAAVNRSVTINVSKANQTITFAGLGTKTFGDADFSVSASSDSGLTVSFAATAGNCSIINGNTVHITGAGSCEITTSQAGDGNYNQATSVARSFTIDQAAQTINFGALSGKFIGNGGIIVSATGGNSGNPVTFASSTTSVCTSGGTNGTTVTFIGLGTCAITALQAGSGNYGAATGASQSFQVNADPTTVTLDTTGHNFINFECATNVISATVRNSVTGAWIQNATVNFVIGSQIVSATTDANGKASAAIVLNQQPGSVTVSASYAGSGNGYNSAGSASTTKTIGASTNVGPGQNASSLYTGSLYYWTTGSTSSTATLTLSATLKDTLASCLGDITKAKVSFYISTGGSFSPVSGAQNLPVGLVNPTDTSVGTASAISQYNIGNNQSVTLTVRVVVSGQYTLNTTQYDQLITIGKPGQTNSLMGGGQIKNDGNPFPANGYLGLNSVNSSFGSQVKFNNSGTNPQGQVQVYIRSCNNSDGTLDPNCDPNKPATHHVYFIKSNSISELSTINGSASFGSKTNVSEVLANGTKVGLDGGTMQVIFTPFGKTIPRDMYVGNVSTCTNQQGCMSITAYKSTGGVWYSSSWGQGAGTTAPHTYVKNVLPGGAIAVQ